MTRPNSLTVILQSARELELEHQEAVRDVKVSTDKINNIKLAWSDLRKFIRANLAGDTNTYENREQDYRRQLNQETAVYDEAFSRMVDRSHRKAAAWEQVRLQRAADQRWEIMYGEEK